MLWLSDLLRIDGMAWAVLSDQELRSYLQMELDWPLEEEPTLPAVMEEPTTFPPLPALTLPGNEDLPLPGTETALLEERALYLVRNLPESGYTDLITRVLALAGQVPADLARQHRVAGDLLPDRVAHVHGAGRRAGRAAGPLVRDPAAARLA